MRRLFPFKGNKPPSSFIENIVNNVHNIFFHSLFRNNNYFPDYIMGFPKATNSKEASLSEPY